MPPTSSSTLVNVVSDAELRLVRLLADTAASSSSPVPASFVTDCEACIAKGDAAQLIKTIVEAEGAVTALVTLDDGEGVSAVSLLGALLNRVKDTNASNELLNALSGSIVRSVDSASSPSATAAKAIPLLAMLYNMRSNSNDKLILLVKMLDLSGAHQPSILEPTASVLGRWTVDPKHLTAMLDEWKVPPAGRRELYRSAAKAAKSASATQQFMLLLVKTYTSSDDDLDAPDCLEASQQTAIGAIRDPVSLFVQQRNMLSLPAIQALGRKTAALFALLKVFQEGNLQDYQSYLQSNGGEGILGEWNLSPDDCSRYMRILSLCSLAADREEIPYALVAEKLDTTSAEIEKWVIAAVSSGLLSAKMDQLEEKVMVERSVVRKFDMGQWRALQSRLHLWKQNVGGILAHAKQVPAV